MGTRESWEQSTETRAGAAHLRVAVDRLQVGLKDQEALQDVCGGLVVLGRSLVHAQAELPERLVLGFSAPRVAAVSVMGYK